MYKTRAPCSRKEPTTVIFPCIQAYTGHTGREFRRRKLHDITIQHSFAGAARATQTSRSPRIFPACPRSGGLFSIPLPHTITTSMCQPSTPPYSFIARGLTTTRVGVDAGSIYIACRRSTPMPASSFTCQYTRAAFALFSVAKCGSPGCLLAEQRCAPLIPPPPVISREKALQTLTVTHTATRLKKKGRNVMQSAKSYRSKRL